MQDADKELNQRWLSVALVFALFGFAFLIAAKRNAVDPDLFHELSLARQAVEAESFPTTDAFAYTPTVDPVVHHEWGTGAALYTVIETWELKTIGLMAVKYLLIVLIGLTCYYVTKLKGGSIAVFVPCAALAIILGGQIGFTTIRAQVFTLLFLALQFLLLEIDQRGHKGWLIPWLIIVVVWANMHAGIVVGLGIICFYCFFTFLDYFLRFRVEHKSSTTIQHAGRALWRSHHVIFAVIVSFVLLLVNPYGVDFPKYLFYGVMLDRPAINEWAPLWVAIPQPGFLMMFAISILISVVAFRQCFKEKMFEAFIVLLTAYLALKHVRHLSLYAVTWVCLVPPRLSLSPIGKSVTKFYGTLSTGATTLAAVIAIALCALCYHGQFWKMQVPTGGDAAMAELRYPVGAVKYLRESNFKGNLQVPFIVGAFVSWNLYPDVKVSIDSRYEVAYPPEALTENHSLYGANDGWQSILKSHGTDAVLVPTYAPLSQEMPNLNDWHLQYRDPSYAIYGRQPNDRPMILNSAEIGWEF